MELQKKDSLRRYSSRLQLQLHDLMVFGFKLGVVFLTFRLSINSCLFDSAKLIETLRLIETD